VPVRLARKSCLISDRSGISGRFVVATLFLLFGCTSLQNAIAQGETRTLSFQHTHRDDSIAVTFKRNGRYDEEGLKKLNYFLRDWRTDEQTQMARELFDILWEIHREVGAKEPIHIISSYRSPQTNSMLRRRSRGVAKFSQHMAGKAIDFFIPGVALEEQRAAALRLQRGGVGFYPASGSQFIHVDVGSIRHWPRMTHDQLARVFPNGKTVHIPSDGHPLKGYELALAEVQRRGSTPSSTSLSAARNAGIQIADAGSASPGRGRHFLARLLGIGADEEEDKEVVAPRGKQVASAAPAGRQEVAAVPMPRARPGPAIAGEFTLAAASPSPTMSTASTEPTPADIVNSRGLWQSSSAPALEPDRPSPAPSVTRAAAASPQPPSREAIGPSGERLAWIVGADPAPPRPPRNIEGALAGAAGVAADISLSVATWTSDPGQNDRISTELALAYAATTHPDAAAPPTAAPMGSLRLANPAGAGNATIAAKKPGSNSPAAKIAQRSADPWLRGIVMTPSVHHSLSVNLLGSPDYRTLRPLMHKPRTMLAMVFSNDPLLGITSVQFSGPAVTFLPTISYPTRTAALQH
jgi:uncharacterized protein YcbK (DUF882 family)